MKPFKPMPNMTLPHANINMVTPIDAYIRWVANRGSIHCLLSICQGVGSRQDPIHIRMPNTSITTQEITYTIPTAFVVEIPLKAASLIASYNPPSANIAHLNQRHFLNAFSALSSSQSLYLSCTINSIARRGEIPSRKIMKTSM